MVEESSTTGARAFDEKSVASSTPNKISTNKRTESFQRNKFIPRKTERVHIVYKISTFEKEDAHPSNFAITSCLTVPLQKGQVQTDSDRRRNHYENLESRGSIVQDSN